MGDKGRHRREVSPHLKRHLSTISNKTMALICVANEAERQCHLGSVDTTDSRELEVVRRIVVSQNELREHLVAASRNGITIEELCRELIEPILARSVVSNLASFSLEQTINASSAAVRRIGRDQ